MKTALVMTDLYSPNQYCRNIPQSTIGTIVTDDGPRVLDHTRNCREDSAKPPAPQSSCVVFHVRADHYVTPKSYTETKPTTSNAVPTWNYAAAQVYGKAKIYYDSKSGETGSLLLQQTHDLSQHIETSIMGYTGKAMQSGPWKVSDAPGAYIKLMQKNIIGIEIQIERLEGDFKMTQEVRL